VRGQLKTSHTGEIEVDYHEGGLVIFHGAMLKVELKFDGRFHSADGGATQWFEGYMNSASVGYDRW
jgi:hypothetical protein